MGAGGRGGGGRGWSIQLIIFAHLFSLRRNSGLGSQSRLFCPVSNTVRAMFFLLREDFNLFFPGRLVSNWATRRGQIVSCAAVECPSRDTGHGSNAEMIRRT